MLFIPVYTLEWFFLLWTRSDPSLPIIPKNSHRKESSTLIGIFITSPMVYKPASFSFLMSEALMPNCYRFTMKESEILEVCRHSRTFLVLQKSCPLQWWFQLYVDGFIDSDRMAILLTNRRAKSHEIEKVERKDKWLKWKKKIRWIIDEKGGRWSNGCFIANTMEWSEIDDMESRPTVIMEKYDHSRK